MSDKKSALLTPEGAAAAWSRAPDGHPDAVVRVQSRAHAVARAQLAAAREAVRAVEVAGGGFDFRHGAAVMKRDIIAALSDAGAEPGGGEACGHETDPVEAGGAGEWCTLLRGHEGEHNTDGPHRPAQPAPSPGAVDKIDWLDPNALRGKELQARARDRLVGDPAPPEPPRAEGFDAGEETCKLWNAISPSMKPIEDALRRAHAAGLASGLEEAARIAESTEVGQKHWMAANLIADAIRARAGEVKP